MVTVNDNSVVQDRNGSKTNLQDGLQSDEREGKLRAETLQKRGEGSGGKRDLEERGHKVGEKKRGES